MKIKYEFANGDIAEVEVSEEVGTFIIDSRRAEESQTRKENRHCYSIDAMEYEGIELAAKDTPETDIQRKEQHNHIDHCLAKLTPIQRKRLEMYADGLSTHEIARLEGCDHKAVLKSINAAKKKFQKFF